LDVIQLGLLSDFTGDDADEMNVIQLQMLLNGDLCGINFIEQCFMIMLHQLSAAGCISQVNHQVSVEQFSWTPSITVASSPKTTQRI